MIFTSLSFLFFFLCFLLLYWWFQGFKSLKWQNALVIAGSYIFYGLWDWRFLGLIIFSSGLDFLLGIYIAKSSKQSQRSLLLAVSVAANLWLLGFFKYFNFFIDSAVSLAALFSLELSPITLEIILPVGISFYTFQTLSYTNDLYKKRIEVCKDPLAFFAFVSFFPQLVAGPIERASRLLPQFQNRRVWKADEAVVGLRYLLLGIFLKIALADNFGVLSNHLLDPVLEPNGLNSILGSSCFALQIFGDFAGYSSMAIGLSKLLGIELMQNFRSPYFAVSLGDFWKRWHISLSTWFRDYLYIPLGGNRSSKMRATRNLLLTFLISGLWHGAQITFVLWGIGHGIALIIEKSVKYKLPKAIARPLVFFLVVILWIPFRAEDTRHMGSLFASLLNFSSYQTQDFAHVLTAFSQTKFYLLLAFSLLMGMIDYQSRDSDSVQWLSARSALQRWSLYFLMALGILLLLNLSVKPNFIYFQF